MFKKIIIICLLCFVSVQAQQYGYGLPNFAWFSTCANNNYTNGWATLQRSFTESDRFYGRLSSAISNKYSQIPINHYCDLKDATRDAYLASPDSYCEFTLFVGHGGSGSVILTDNTVDITEKPQGSYTKWAFYYSCSTLNCDMNKFNTVLNGAHILLGFKSKRYQFDITYKCGLFHTQTCHGANSDYVWDEFADRWINQEETIWDAYSEAVYNRLWVAANGLPGVVGLAPMFVARTASSLEGRDFSGDLEKFNDSYKGPINSSTFIFGWNVYGNPQY